MFHKDFLPVCGLSFHSPNGVFLRAQVLNFNEVQLLTQEEHFFFTGCDFGGISTKWSPNLCSPKFSPLLPSRSLVLYFYVYLFHQHLLKRLSFCYWSVFALLYKIIWLFIRIYSWTFCSALLIYSSLLLLILHCIDYCSFIVNLEVK